VNDQEIIMGLRSIAVPVAVEGRVVAAMGLSVEVARVSAAELVERCLPSLREAAASLAAALGARDPAAAAIAHQR
jgi:IclR family pca regulon transcriptional regulator